MNQNVIGSSNYTDQGQEQQSCKQSCTRQVRLTVREKNTGTISFSPVGLLCERKLSAPRGAYTPRQGRKGTVPEVQSNGSTPLLDFLDNLQKHRSPST